MPINQFIITCDCVRVVLESVLDLRVAHVITANDIVQTTSVHLIS